MSWSTLKEDNSNFQFYLLIPSSIRSSLCHFLFSPHALEFLDDHNRNNGNVVGFWSIPVGMVTSGISDHSHGDHGLGCSSADRLFGCIIYNML